MERKDATSSWMRWIARGLLILWIGFWVWFNIASGISEVGTDGIGALLAHSMVAIVILAAGVVAWRWPLAGGVLLLLLAAFGQWFFHPNLQVAAVLTLPPAVVGLLLVAAWKLARPRLQAA
ncbi:MAG: DUF7670 domain-containing protein [Planctomycetota bacterium]|jgi:hypothetical protein